MTEHPSHLHPHAHDHAHEHGHAHAQAPVRGPVARPKAPALAEPASWLMQSGGQRLFAALLVIAAVLAAMAWATSSQG